jgi:hypothetical protein
LPPPAQPIWRPAPRRIGFPRPNDRHFIDDYTRKTPAHLILPLLLQQLHAAGIARRTSGWFLPWARIAP